MRTKVVAATRDPAPKTANAASAAQTATAARTTRSKLPRAPRDDDEGYPEADRLALASVGHWPPTPPGHRGAFWSKHDDWPRDWTLTGGDLGRFRGEINLTRAVFAAQLGVPSVVVKDAELSPREKVGPALQIAVRRAMDHAIQEERAAAQAQSESAAASLPSVSGPVVAAHAASDAAVFTGADLAGLRAERRLSQREMADLLGSSRARSPRARGRPARRWASRCKRRWGGWRREAAREVPRRCRSNAGSIAESMPYIPWNHVEYSGIMG